MSLSGLLVPNSYDLFADSITANEMTVETLDVKTVELKEVSSLLVAPPNAGSQKIFANSDLNNNIQSKIASGATISLNSAISPFIVSSNPDDNMPYTSIQDAINDAKLVGQPVTVIVRNGTYNEDINLEPNVSIWGIPNDAKNVTQGVILNGSITANTTGNMSVMNLNIVSTNANCISSTSGTITLFVNNCVLRALVTGSCVSFNNPNILCFMEACNLYESPVGVPLVNIVAANQLIIKNTLIGVLNNNLVRDLVVNNSLLAIVYSINSCRVVTTGTAFTIFGYNFTITGDTETLFLNGAGTQALYFQNMTLSDTTSGTDFITGTGSVLYGSNALLGRTTVAGTVVQTALTIY